LWKTNNIKMRNGPIRETTRERHDEIFEYYKEIINGYGPLVKGLSKEFLYEEVANKFHYSVDKVRRIISRRLKNDRGRAKQY